MVFACVELKNVAARIGGRFEICKKSLNDALVIDTSKVVGGARSCVENLSDERSKVHKIRIVDDACCV